MKQRTLLLLTVSLALAILLVTWSRPNPAIAPTQDRGTASGAHHGKAGIIPRPAWTSHPLPRLMVPPPNNPGVVESNHTLALHRADILNQHPLSRELVQYLTTDLLLWDAILQSNDPSDDGVVAKAVTLGLPATDARLALDGCSEWDSYAEFLERIWENEDLAKVRDRVGTLGIHVPPEIMVEANKFCAFNTWYGSYMQRLATDDFSQVTPSPPADPAKARALLEERDRIVATVSTFFRERWQARYGVPPGQAIGLVEALRTVHASNFSPPEMSFPRIKPR